MKLIGTLLFLAAGISLFAQQEEEDGPAHKAALQRMIDERGGDSNMGRYVDEMTRYRQANPNVLSANWTYIDDSGSQNGDVGRTNSVTIDTLNPGRFYVCTPHSGVWRTNNDGATFTPITEALPTQSTSRLVIDYTNSNVLYLATGAHNMDMLPNSIGVFKSTDGGNTWNATGLTFSSSALENIGDLVINPENPNSLIAATTDGLYRTFNAGATWTQIVNDNFCSVRYKPGDTATMFAVGTHYYRTNDGWTNWAMITSSFVDSYTWKYEYAVRVTASAPNIVYLMTAGNSVGPGMRSYIHKSTDGGWSFVVIDSLFGEPCVQFEVSQETTDKYLIGFYRIYKRENSISALQQISYYSSSQSPYVHSDQRGLFFDPQNDNIVYTCNDGGLKRSINNGISFQNLNANMQLAHLYNFGQSQSVAYKILPATLDVPPYLLGSSGIYRTFPLVEAFVAAMSPVNDSVYMLGHFSPYFTSDDWTTSFQSSNVLLGNASNYPKSFQYSETQENVNYHASQGFIYTSSDYGANHPLALQLPWFTSNVLYEIDASGANANYFYLRFADSVYVTTNNGATFNDITPGLPYPAENGSALTIDPQDEENVWITFSGYTANEKVYFSSDAGQTWTNISAGLPNVPVNDIVSDPNGTPGAVYCATDGGVFYRDNNTAVWQLYNTGLPNVIVTDLDIQHNIGKLRASTFGRGMWESDLYTTGISENETPVSSFNVYPNPVNDQITVFATHPLDEITITDLTGRIVVQVFSLGTTATLNVGALSPGCYFVRSGESVVKILKR